MPTHQWKVEISYTSRTKNGVSGGRGLIPLQKRGVKTFQQILAFAWRCQLMAEFTGTHESSHFAYGSGICTCTFNTILPQFRCETVQQAGKHKWNSWIAFWRPRRHGVVFALAVCVRPERNSHMKRLLRAKLQPHLQAAHIGSGLLHLGWHCQHRG